ncbi:hypothetical protein CEUSTIGMA_g1998.t1 [Chlamydomonas eustigma]|uniref:J domain-containing protein n=1 Tax=Chlamydomonas eustigma TaxID=1157962 RepID=A0A250WUQ8_9CHLO|nr:hypothetical protein CEUSTIGMA_g1998.t1 [Chlamydomonas eustigma]|eukprot:GAX74548.1 hypothetical protein CEUSTIGMA_g1998.t1 [Chlamydomonas eustigma]
MSTRRVDRLFNQTYVSSSSAAATNKATLVPEKEVSDSIKRILDAWEKKDYFKLLQLQEPTADDLGRPVWPCTSNDVSRAFRKLSILVHPDKNPGEDARKSFEALNEAHRMLRDPDSLCEVLRSAATRLRAEKERSEARSTVDQRIQLNATKNARARDMRKEEGKHLEGVILDQMKRRQEEGRRKMEAASRAKVTELHERDKIDKMGAVGSSKGAGDRLAEDSDDEDVPRVLKKRKKPAFI